MKRNREILDYEARFESEEFTIIATVASTGWRVERLGRAQHLTAGLELLSWHREEDEGEVHTGKWHLSCKADEAYCKALEQAAPPDSTIRVRVRQHRMGLLAVTLPIRVDGGTPAPAPAQITCRDKTLGAFLLDSELGRYHQQLPWRGHTVALCIANDTPGMMGKAMDTVRALMAELEPWDKLARAFAANRLPSLAGDTDSPGAASPADGLVLRSIEGASRGRFTLRFDGVAPIAGRTLVISGNLKDGPKRLELIDQIM